MVSCAGCALALAAWIQVTPLAAGQGSARVTLLPVGGRASIVVEVDEATLSATAIEATDNQTVAVEIGPVRGKVVNQVLQAATDSPLVNQVRVRGVTQGSAGTLVTVHIATKAPVTGSVRRTGRRIYIDLAPRATETQLKVKRDIPSAGTPPAIQSQAGASRVAAASTPRTTPAAPVSVTAPVERVAKVVRGTAAPPEAPPRDSGPVAAPVANPIGEIETRAAQLVQIGDVRGLERLRTELETQKAAIIASGTNTGDIDALSTRLDQFVDTAQRNRLAADAELFRTRSAAAAAAPTPPAESPAKLATAAATLLDTPRGTSGESVAEFSAKFRPLRPQLEQLARTADTWRVTPPTTQDIAVVSALLQQLRNLQPPTTIAGPFADVRTYLELLELWGSSMGPPSASEQALFDRARVAIRSLLTVERSSLNAQ